MEDQKQTSFTFEIDNFLEKETIIESPVFSSGGCEWLVRVHPKGDGIDDHLSLYLHVANPKSLRLGWERRVDYSILLLNQSGKELSRISRVNELFCAAFSGWGSIKAVPLKELQEKGNNKLIVKTEVKVVQVVDEGDVTGNDVYNVSGFQVLYSQVVSVCRLFVEHPDIAVNLKPKNQVVKTAYMNILLGLIETLNKPAHSITETELENAQSELMELTETGFQLDWLKKKIDEISLERKKVIPDEELVKNLKAELDNEKVLSLEKKVSDLIVELDNEKVKSTTLDAKVLSLEEEVSDLKKKVSNLRVEIDNEKDKPTTLDAKVLSLEEEVSDLETKLNMNKKKKWFGSGTGTEPTVKGKGKNTIKVGDNLCP